MPFLPGFDEHWQDAPNFVAGVNQRLWDNRRPDLTGLHCTPDLIVHDAGGEIHGTAHLTSVIEAELAGFPDLERLSEDIIWGATGYKAFHASSRMLCQGSHEGPGVLGAPTGRQLRWRVMMDSWCRSNAMAEIWMVRDTGAMLAGLGQTPEGFTRKLIEQIGGPEACPPPLRPAPHALYDGTGNESAWGDTLADLVTRIAEGQIGLIAEHYDPAAELSYAGGVQGAGPKDAEAFWLGLRASVPEARLQVVHATGMEEPLSSPRASIRWWLSGRHDGWGRFGAPSGTHLDVMGITHAEFGPAGLRRDWTVIDDVAVWQQILLGQAAGAHAPQPMASAAPPVPSEATSG